MSAATKSLMALGSNAGPNKITGSPIRTFKVAVDFSVAANVLTNGQSMSLLWLPAHNTVKGLRFRITTTATGTGDKLDIGDEASATRYVSQGDDAVATLIADGSTGAGAQVAPFHTVAATDIRITAHTGTLAGLIGVLYVDLAVDE